MSDGTLRAIGLLAAVFQRPVPSLIAVRKPEATINPGRTGVRSRSASPCAKHTQVVIIRQVRNVDVEWYITDRSCRIVDWIEGATAWRRVSAVIRTRKALHDHLMVAGRIRCDRNTLEPVTAVR